MGRTTLFIYQWPSNLFKLKPDICYVRGFDLRDFMGTHKPSYISVTLELV